MGKVIFRNERQIAIINIITIIKKVTIAETANFLIRNEKIGPPNNTRTTHNNIC